jgi:hypothetical protein
MDLDKEEIILSSWLEKMTAGLGIDLQPLDQNQIENLCNFENLEIQKENNKVEVSLIQEPSADDENFKLFPIHEDELNDIKNHSLVLNSALVYNFLLNSYNFIFIFYNINYFYFT